MLAHMSFFVNIFYVFWPVLQDFLKIILGRARLSLAKEHRALASITIYLSQQTNYTKEACIMNTRFQEIRDPKTRRLLGIYFQEDGIFESRQKGRVMRIRFPPGTPIKFIFSDSEPAA